MTGKRHEMAKKVWQPVLVREELLKAAPCLAILEGAVLRIGYFSDLCGAKLEEIADPALEKEGGGVEIGAGSGIETLSILESVHDWKSRAVRIDYLRMCIHGMTGV